jgi:hypothetical protein
MVKKALAPVTALVSDSLEEAEASKCNSYRECDPSEQCLFHGKDEVGREGWFLRLEVTGMYTRRCGPFETREEAVECLAGFANDVDTAFTEISNHIHQPGQMIVAEGVPRLAATNGR